MTSTRFFDCDLTRADFAKAKLPRARFDGSVLSELKGAEHRRNVVIESSQIVPLASAVFAGLHIHIEDERDAPDPQGGAKTQ